jgi:outer membrane protein assembly factor BamB
MSLCLSCNDEIPIDHNPRFTLSWKNDYGKQLMPSDIIGVIHHGLAFLQLDSVLQIVDDRGNLIKKISTGAHHSLVGSRNMILHEGSVLINDVSWIRKYDMETGNLAWNIDLDPNTSMLLSEMSLKGNDLYVPKLGGAYIIDIAAGTIKDIIDLKEILHLDSSTDDIRVRELIVTSENKLLFGIESYDPDHTSSFVTSIDLISEDADWLFHSEVDTLAPGTSSAPITKMGLFEDKLSFLRGSYVTSINVHTGELIWEKRYPDLGFFFGHRVSDDGIVYIGSTGYDRTVIALDANSGNELWRNNLQLASVGYLQVKDDLLFVLAEHLVILNRHKGEVLFDFAGDTGDYFYVPPTIGEDFFIGISSQRVYG